MPEDVAELVHLRRVGAECVLHVRQDRKRLVVDVDELGCKSSLLERLGGHDGDRLSLVAHDA